MVLAHISRPKSSHHKLIEIDLGHERKTAFARAIQRQRAAYHEFKFFREHAKTTILASAKRIPGFDELEKYFSFYVDLPAPETVRAWFGTRSMFRPDLAGKIAAERGAHLLYSLGPTGDVVVALFPCTSSLGRVLEDQLYIGVGRFTAHQLLRRVRSDVRLLVAYNYVSSLDAQPTWGEWLRIAWLRRIKPSQIDGKFVAGSSTLIVSSVRAASRSALLAFFTAIMKPIAIVIVALVLTHFGKQAWIEFIKTK